jgi:hypothetical protein
MSENGSMSGQKTKMKVTPSVPKIPKFTTPVLSYRQSVIQQAEDIIQVENDNPFNVNPYLDKNSEGTKSIGSIGKKESDPMAMRMRQSFVGANFPVFAGPPLDFI